MVTKKKPAPYQTEAAPQLNWDALDSILANAEQSQQQEQSGPMRRLVADPAITLVKGAIAVPEAAVGLADLATEGQAGKVLENADGAIGFRPKEARAFLDTLYSPEQQAAFRAVQDAPGFMGKI